MKLRRTLGPSWRALLAHRARAALAFTSVAIGVAGILLSGALGVGAEIEMRAKIAAMGVNLLVVRPAQVQRLVQRKTVRGSMTTLGLADYEAVATLPTVAASAPGVEGALLAKSGSSAMIATVLGTNADYFAVRRFGLAEGRLLDAEDERETRRVAVLGARVRSALFPGEEAVGREIRLGKVPFEVIGSLVAKGAMADGSDLDSQVLIPARTALRRVYNTRWLSSIFVSAVTPAATSAAARDITAVLRSRHVPRASAAAGAADDFAVQDSARFFAMQRQATGVLSEFASGVALLALFIGGTGILALLWLAVRERRGEIGLRMAIGARPGDILAQFLLEAAMLALGGWVLGLLVAGLGASVLAFATDWRLGFPPAALLGSLGTVLLIGLGFGAAPAVRAARLVPVAALRAE